MCTEKTKIIEIAQWLWMSVKVGRPAAICISRLPSNSSYICKGMKWYRKELFQSTLTSKGCMRLLPRSSKADVLQQLVVANQNGVVWCMHWKKQAVIDFKTFPGTQINALTLGGTDKACLDKIFYAAGSTVNGYNRKGKHFLAFETNKTEPVVCMSANNLDMALCTENVMTLYHNCIEKECFLSNDRIFDVLCYETSAENQDLIVVIACENNALKFIRGKRLIASIDTSAPPNVIYMYGEEADDNKSMARRTILYGTFTATIGEVEATSEGIVKKWELPSMNGCSIVNAIECYDLTASGQVNLLAGRDDGLIEMYLYQRGETATLLDCIKCHECIVAVQCGNFMSNQNAEILACTFSGRLYVWSVEEPLMSSSTDEKFTDLEMELQALREEVDRLKEQLKQCRQATKRGQQTTDTLSHLPSLPIHDRLFLNEHETTHHLSIEMPISIDWILLRSEIAIDLIDMEQNSAIFSLVDLDEKSSEALLATYRCQTNMTRFEVKMRTIEGKYGNIEVYICPRVNPPICQVRSYAIKSLSLHRRAKTYDQNRPQNELKVMGNFGPLEAYSLMAFCLPGMPDHPNKEDQLSYTFVSCFMDTQLHFECRDNEIIILTDNLSTITILQDVINRAASNQGWKVTTTCNINKKSVPFVLELISKRLEEYADLMQKTECAEILKDVTVYAEEEQVLSDEFKDILQNASRYLDKRSAVQAAMDRMKGFLTDLFVDSFKFKGQDVRHLVPQLIQIIEDYDKEKLLLFFNSDWKTS